MTWHDLRATGITWRAVRGDEPLETTQKYIREAEVIRDGFGEVFPPLPASLLGAGEGAPPAGGGPGGPGKSSEALKTAGN